MEHNQKEISDFLTAWKRREKRKWEKRKWEREVKKNKWKQKESGSSENRERRINGKRKRAVAVKIEKEE